MDTWQRRREAGWRLPAEGSIATVVVIAVLVVAVLVLLAVLVQDPPSSSASPRGDGAPAVRTGRVTHVVDGDTIDLADGTRIRLAIVDTPEVHGGLEPCGREASAFTRDLVLGEQVTVWRPTSAPATDRYGRLLGEVVRPDGRSLNVALVTAGLGTVDDRFAAEDPDLAARARAAQADAPSPACAPVSAPSQDQETSDPPAPATAVAPLPR